MLFFLSWWNSLISLLSAIKAFLKKDQNIYGGGIHDKVAPEELNSWQQGIDDSLAAAAAAALEA